MTEACSSTTPALRWARAPERHPQIGPGAVHVWRADLDLVEDQLLALLSAAESARGGRIVDQRRRRRWMGSHGLLRALLGRYLDAEPSALEFATGPHGKPTVGGEAEISFNLSHSGAIALYGFTTTGPIGVDVELSRRPIDAPAIAARSFGPEESRRLAALPPRAREHEFLRAWVRHEARLKYLGVGIGGTDSDGRDDSDDTGEPWIAELAAGTRAAGAVAARAQPVELQYWQWRV